MTCAARQGTFSNRSPLHQRMRKQTLILSCGNILSKNNTCKGLVPCFMSRNSLSQKCSYAQKAYFSKILLKNVITSVNEHFSLAKIIYPHSRCGKSRSWINSMIITQVHLVLGTKCAVLSNNIIPQLSQVLRECAIGMLTAGMSTRAVAREFMLISPP
jgi:hypothetical protein